MFSADDHVIKLLKGMGPSNIDIEMRSLAPEGGGSLNVMQSFLQMISYMLCTKRDFELAQAYLALYLKVNFFKFGNIDHFNLQLHFTVGVNLSTC